MCQALREGPKTYLHGIYFPGSFLSLLNKQTIKKKKDLFIYHSTFSQSLPC